MSDALVSPEVAATAGVASLLLLGAAVRKVTRQRRDDERLVPLMGVTGAFVFAAQMINFTIPGTGSSATSSAASCSQRFWGLGQHC